MPRPLLLVVLLGLIAVASARLAAADPFTDQLPYQWHQWRGPHANSVAPHGDPPTTWNEQSGANIRWKVPLPGRGTSTPVVWGEQIFITTVIKTDREAPPDDDAESSGEVDDEGRPRQRAGRGQPTHFHQFVLLCLDRATGRTRWQQVAAEVVPHQGHHPTSSFVSASPVTDGQYVYCSFGSRGVYCYDVDGNFRWRTDLGQFQIKYAFGEGSSPTLYRDVLVVNCDHEGDSFLALLDAATGQERWRTPREENTTWNTPLVTEFAGRSQIITNGAVASRGYDLETGEVLWEYGDQPGVDAIPSPLRSGDLAICVSGLRGSPAYAVPLGARGKLTDEDLAWKHTRGTPQVSSAALVGDRLFFTKDRAGILSCLDAQTGEPIFDQRRLPGLDDIYASPVAAAGRLYIAGRNGRTVVLDALADDVRVLAENELEETIHGSPIIVGREILIRGEESLYSIAE